MSMFPKAGHSFHILSSGLDHAWTLYFLFHLCSPLHRSKCWGVFLLLLMFVFWRLLKWDMGPCLYLSVSISLAFCFSLARFSLHHEKKRLLLCPQPPLQLPLRCFCMRSSASEKGPLFFSFQAIFHCWCQWAVSIYSEGNWGEKQVAAEVHPLISLLFFERTRASRWAGQNAHNVYFIPRYTNTMWVLVAHCACCCSNPSPNVEFRARAGRGPSFFLFSPLSLSFFFLEKPSLPRLAQYNLMISLTPLLFNTVTEKQRIGHL